MSSVLLVWLATLYWASVQRTALVMEIASMANVFANPATNLTTVRLSHPFQRAATTVLLMALAFSVAAIAIQATVALTAPSLLPPALAIVLVMAFALHHLHRHPMGRPTCAHVSQALQVKIAQLSSACAQ